MREVSDARRRRSLSKVAGSSSTNMRRTAMSGPVTERGRVATAALAQSAPSQALAASAEVEMTPAPAAAQTLYAATRSTLH